MMGRRDEGMEGCKAVHPFIPSSLHPPSLHRGAPRAATVRCLRPTDARPSMQTRRDLLRSALGAAALAGVPRSLLALPDLFAPRRAARPHLDAALRAARWIRAARI